MSEQPNIPIGNWEAAEHWAEELTKPSSDEVAALRRGIQEISDQCTQFEDELTAAQQRVAELEKEKAELDVALKLSNEKTLHWMEAAGKLDGDNARLREQVAVAELEQKLQIIKSQLSNIEWNLQRQDNPSKDDWLRIVRTMLESLK